MKLQLVFETRNRIYLQKPAYLYFVDSDEKLSMLNEMLLEELEWRKKGFYMYTISNKRKFISIKEIRQCTKFYYKAV